MHISLFLLNFTKFFGLCLVNEDVFSYSVIVLLLPMFIWTDSQHWVGNVLVGNFGFGRESKHMVISKQ